MKKILALTICILLALAGAGWADYTDNFNTYGGDGSGLGVNWTTMTGFNAPLVYYDGSSIYGLRALDVGGGGAYYSGGTFANNQFCQIKVDTFPRTFGCSMFVRVQAGANTSYQAYFPDSTTVRIFKNLSGVSELGTATTITALVAGDTIRFEATGTTTTTLKVYVNGGLVKTETDSSSAITDGKPGLFSPNNINSWRAPFVGGDINLFSVTCQDATDKAQTTATLNGTVATNDGTVTDAGFYISKDNNPPTAADTVVSSSDFNGAANGTGAFTGSATGLTANTTYHCVAFSTNGGGTVTSANRDFTTVRAASTFYMRSDGTAANIAAATGPSTTAANCMNVTVHNAGPFVPGDTIKVSDKGGTYTTGIVPPSSGSDAAHIVYSNVTGETPVINLSWNSTKAQNAAGLWELYNGGPVYRTTSDLAYYGAVMWEDGVPLNGQLLSKDPSTLTAGQWLYNAGRMYYYPTTGTPADHDLKTTWLGTDPPIYIGFNLENKSNIEVSGLTISYCGFGFSTGNSGAPSSVVKNQKIHHNNIDHTYWAIFGNVAHNAIQQDTEIYNNTINYCSSGISIWSSDADPLAGHTQQALRINVHDNVINNHYFINDTYDWTYALANTAYFADHEAISFQDLKDCSITSNTITLPRAPLHPYTDGAIYQPRGIKIYLTENSATTNSGNLIAYNRLNGCFNTAIDITFGGAVTTADFGGNTISCNVAKSDFSVAGPSYVFYLYWGNSGTTMNYFCNNTIDYPVDSSTVLYGIYHGSANGKWTIKNNIVKANRIVNAAALTDMTYDYNNYFAYFDPELNGGTPYGYTRAFVYIGGGYNLAGWQALAAAPDANAAFQDPKLINSAITNASPTEVKTGGTPIENITVISGVGQLGIDGKTYSVATPAMGAYAGTTSLGGGLNLGLGVSGQNWPGPTKWK